MSEIPLCSIVISLKVPTNKIELLETSLRMSSIKVEKSTKRALGVDDLIVVATVASGAAATAQLIEYGIKVAKALKNWRRELRSKGIEPEGELKHPDRSSLNLSKASDEEIDEWFPHE